MWRGELDYVVYIPEVLILEDEIGTIEISADIEAFKETSKLSVVLKESRALALEENDEIIIEYQMKNPENDAIIAEGDVIAEFSVDDDEKKQLVVEVCGDEKYSRQIRGWYHL